MTADESSRILAGSPLSVSFEGLAERPAFFASITHQVRKRPFYALAALLLLTFVALAALAPVLPMEDPQEQSILDRTARPLTTDSAGHFHLFGTDQLGRDILSRVIYGARISLTVALAAVVVSGTIGTLVGLLAGYRGGIVDLAVMRIVDFLMAFPALLITIFLLYLMGSSVLNMVVLLSALGWVGFARIVRAQTMSLKNQPFVEGAIAIGCTDRRIVLRHILPHLTPVLATIAVLDFVTVILAEAGLSFLGLGIQPPTASLGRMVADGQAGLFTGSWWLFLIPGLAIFVLVLCANLTSRWLQDIVNRSPASVKGAGK